jgi:hypothetical protein
VSAFAERGSARRFAPTSGTASGWTGVGLAGVALVVILRDGHSLTHLRFALGVAIFGLLDWCYLLRPRLVIGSAELELRNPFSSWHVPLVHVRRVAVRAIMSVYTEERRFDGVAIGRPVRSLRNKPARAPMMGIPGLGGRRLPDMTMISSPQRPRPADVLDANAIADLVVEQVLVASDEARTRPHDGRVARRSWAWLEIGLLAALVIGLVITMIG